MSFGGVDLGAAAARRTSDKACVALPTGLVIDWDCRTRFGTHLPVSPAAMQI
jgi:hypothetical protein